MQEKRVVGQTNETDESLMARYQKGDEHAFEELYRRYSGRVYAYLRKRLDQREWIDDVFQMVFTKFHRKRHQYDPTHGVDQWVFVMTKTVLLDFWKTTARKTSRYFSQTLDEALVHSLEESPLTETLDLATSLPEGTLSTLSVDQKRAVELKYFNELSYQEIATKMNRTEASVRQLVSRGLKMIRGALKSEHGGKSS